jgi:hypothetical protein
MGTFVGLDPDLCRSLAANSESAGDVAGMLAGRVAGLLQAADIADNGALTLMREVDEELGLLGRLLRTRANQMESFGSRASSMVVADAEKALWASLTDKTGAGVDVADDWMEPGGEVPMSSSVAASTLADYLRLKGPEAELRGEELVTIVENDRLGFEVRAAAKFMIENDEVWGGTLDGLGSATTVRQLENFVTTNRNLAIVAAMYDRLDTAKQGDLSRVDGKVSYGDIESAIANAGGRFTATEIAALQWILKHRNSMWSPVESRKTLTALLVNRQVFAERPDLAAEYIADATRNPGQFLFDSTWFDDVGARSWLAAAVSSTNDPKKQSEILLNFALVYQQTRPEDLTFLGFVHDLLDFISFIDPTQIADGVNGLIYTVEGDYVNAGLSAVGMMLPIGGGKVLRLTREAIVGVALKEADDVTAALTKAIADGTITTEMLDKAVKDIATQFGDDTARIFKTKVDDLTAATNTPTGAANRAAHQAYTDGLRAAMERPHVVNSELSGLMDDLYRPGAKVGSGSTAAAVRHELATGAQVGGRSHVQKAGDYARALEDWVRRNPTASPGDRSAAENVARDLRNALGDR